MVINIIIIVTQVYSDTPKLTSVQLNSLIQHILFIYGKFRILK